jgi:hypothetical protein
MRLTEQAIVLPYFICLPFRKEHAVALHFGNYGCEKSECFNLV